MEHSTLSPFAAWESFYVIVGSSSAALTGLQFVVIVLAADLKALRDVTTARVRYSDDRALLRCATDVGDSECSVAGVFKCCVRSRRLWGRGSCVRGGGDQACAAAD